MTETQISLTCQTLKIPDPRLLPASSFLILPGRVLVVSVYFLIRNLHNRPAKAMLKQ